jgi:hypothetical protein
VAQLAAGQGREEEPAVCLVSKWEERRSKEALAIALRVATRRVAGTVPVVIGVKMLEPEKVRGSPQGK